MVVTNKVFMKLFLIIAFLAVELFAASAPVWGTPPKVKVSTYTVEYYQKYRTNHRINSNKLKDLIRSDEHKNAFVEQLFTSIKNKYPSVKTSLDPKSKSDAGATAEVFRNADFKQSQIVYFAGHGNQQELLLYDYSVKLRARCCCDRGDVACFEATGLNGSAICPNNQYVCPDDEYGRVFGGETRWVILDACLTLNVNKSNELSKPLSLEYIDFFRVNALRTVFTGVHAILGYYSLAWQGMRPGDGFSTDAIPRFFAENFIEKKETIWNAFSKACEKFVSNYGTRYGLKPAIAFLRGYDKNGVYHDTSTETFERTYNKPIYVNGSLELFIMYEEYGVPSYSGSTINIGL